MANESYTVTGILYKKSQKQTISDKFSKIDFIIETEGQYPQYLQIQAGNDKMKLLDSINVNDSVTAQLNVKGRLWTGPDGIEKCFNTLEVWKIEKVGAVQQTVTHQAVVSTPTPQLPIDDDLPF